MTARLVARLSGVLAAACLAAACIPYTVGSTAQPLPRGRIESSLSAWSIPSGIESRYDTTSVPFFGFDSEVRFGLDDRSDIGVRIPSLSGVVVNYKRRLGGDFDTERAAVAIMVGGGLVNLGDHLHFEVTLLGSGAQRETLTPYGGLRVMQVLPVVKDAVSDQPTAGFFLGVRIGRVDLGVSPEIGVFYDHSALGVRKRDVIVVPSVTIHGAELIRALIRR